MMSPRVQLILRRALLYPLYFLICFLTFAYCTFPYDRVRDRVEQEVERAIPGADIEILELRPSWLTGIYAAGIRFRLASDDPREAALELSIREATVRYSLFSRLFGYNTANFWAELGSGGTVEGMVSDGGTESQLQMHLVDIGLGRIGLLRRLIPLPVTGDLGGDIDVRVDDDIEQTLGNVDLTIAGMSIADGRAQLPIPGMQSGITIPQINLGDFRIVMPIERGVGRLAQFGSASDHLESRGAGTIRFLRPIRNTSIDLLLRVAIQQAYRTENSRVDAIMPLIEQNPQVAPYRASDGAFQFRVAGSLGSTVRAQPAGNTPFPQ